jgi:hypothetical protein
MVGRNSVGRSPVSKGRARELAIVVAALLVACILGVAVRSGLIDPAAGNRPDIVAR